jgi:hypothetical protein
MTSVGLWIIIAILTILCATLLWYIRELMRPLRFFYTNADSISLMLEEYLEHLQRVYSMDVFYGDETLKSLIEHTKYLSGETEKYKGLFMFEEEDDGYQEEI